MRCGLNLESQLLSQCGMKTGREARLFFTRFFPRKAILIWLTGSCCACFPCLPAHRCSVHELPGPMEPKRSFQSFACIPASIASLPQAAQWHGSARGLHLLGRLPGAMAQEGLCRNSVSLFCCDSESKFLIWISR